MKTLLFLTIGFFGTLSFASSESLPQAICPALTDDASQILSDIQSLQDDINKDLDDCKSMSDKLASIAEVMRKDDWSDVKKKMKGEDVELEGEVIDELSVSVHNVSQSLAETVTMLTGSGAACVDQSHKTSFLGKLSGVVKEVASIAGQTSGPYGMAVNLGGQFLSAALSGIEKALPSNVYNFRDPEDEKIFMNQFCSYTEIHKDTEDYLGMPTRREELKELDLYLTQKIEVINDKCPECAGVKSAWLAQEASNKIMPQLKEDLKIVELGDDRDSHNFSRCAAIHDAFYTENSHLDALMSLLADYRNPMLKEGSKDYENINALIQTMNEMSGHYPKLPECAKLTSEEDTQWAHSFNKLMRDSLIDVDSRIFGQQIRDFKNVTKRKYVDNLGDYMETSLKRQKWIKKERVRVLGILRDPNYGISVAAVQDSRKSLDKHFMTSHFPRFIRFLASRNLKEVKKIDSTLKKNERARKRSRVSHDERLLTSEARRVDSELRMALEHTKALNRYCEYVRYLTITNAKVEKACVQASSKLKSAYALLLEKNSTLKTQIDAVDPWVIPNGSYQTSRVTAYSSKLSDWNARGDERWCTWASQKEICVEKRKEKAKEKEDNAG